MAADVSYYSNTLPPMLSELPWSYCISYTFKGNHCLCFSKYGRFALMQICDFSMYSPSDKPPESIGMVNGETLQQVKTPKLFFYECEPRVRAI